MSTGRKVTLVVIALLAIITVNNSNILWDRTPDTETATTVGWDAQLQENQHYVGLYMATSGLYDPEEAVSLVLEMDADEAAEARAVIQEEERLACTMLTEFTADQILYSDEVSWKALEILFTWVVMFEELPHLCPSGRATAAELVRLAEGSQQS